MPADPLLRPWLDLCKEHGATSRFIKALDSTGQRKFWYAYFGAVPIQTVEVFEKEEYRTYAGPELDELVSRITEEKKTLSAFG